MQGLFLGATEKSDRTTIVPLSVRKIFKAFECKLNRSKKTAAGRLRPPVGIFNPTS
jgi:hypothetical protein